MGANAGLFGSWSLAPFRRLPWWHRAEDACEYLYMRRQTSTSEGVKPGNSLGRSRVGHGRL